MDPRAVLRDHGLWEEIDHPKAREQFEIACTIGNLEVVRAYVALGIDVNRAKMFEEKTPLILAAEHDQCDVVLALAAAGADLQARDRGGETAVMTAIEHSHPAVLRTLLDLGVSPDVLDNRGRPPLVEALDSGKSELIEIMLGSKASILAGAASRRSALHWCLSRRDNVRMRELLARPEADPNLSTEEGNTLMHYAAATRNAGAIDALVDAGADPCRTNRWGWNPREVAIMLEIHEIAERFEQLGVPLNREAEITYFRAIHRNQRSVVIELLDRGLPLETRDWYGHTGFSCALDPGTHAVVGNYELAELLRERGADINALDGNDDNAFVRVENTAGRKWLMQIGVAVSYRDSHGKLRQPGLTAVLVDDDPELLQILLDAPTLDLSDLSDCRYSLLHPRYGESVARRSDTLRTLAAAGADLEVVDQRGRSLLFDYIKDGLEPCVLALLEIGVDIEREDDGFATPLIESCDATRDHETQARITAALLARGADPNKTDWLGLTAWEIAETQDNHACMEVLERSFEQRRAEALAGRCDLECLRHWIRKGEHALVREILRAGFDPNPPAIDRHGLRPSSSPLTTAIGIDEQMVEILLEGGADPNLVLDAGDTALFGAVAEEHVGMVRRLLAAGANPNVCDDKGETPMYWAAASDNLEFMQLLCEAGASVQPRACGLLPLWEAARLGNLQGVRWLLAHGADIDARNEGRVTALHIAIEEGEIEVALALIAAGADPTVRDAAGRSAIDLAAEYEELRVLFHGRESE